MENPRGELMMIWVDSVSRRVTEMVTDKGYEKSNVVVCLQANVIYPEVHSSLKKWILP